MISGSPRLVLLGGGHAHLHVLQDLARAPLATGNCVLVSPQDVLSYSGMVPGVVAGLYPPAACTIPLGALAAAADAHFVQGLAVGLDATARQVHLADGSTLAYDVLSLDTGGQQEFHALNGAAEHAHFVRPLGAFMKRLMSQLMLQLASRPTDGLASGSGWVVIGGGAAGFELAMALRHRGLPAALVTGGPYLLPGYPPGVVQRAERALARAGVQVLRSRAVAVRADAVEMQGGEVLRCEGCLVATGTTAPPWLAGSGLALDPQGFVQTGSTLQSVSHADVLAAGDVASRMDVDRPRSGVHAVRAGPPLAHNLRQMIAGLPLVAYIPPRRTLNLLACSGQRAIASFGNWSAEGRWAWWWKDRIDRAFVAKHGGPGILPAPTRVA